MMRPFIGVVLLAMATSAKAALTVNGTRFIYPAHEHSLTVHLGNNGARSILAQVWLDCGDVRAAPGDLEVPFVVLPPLVRLDPKQHQALQVRYTGERLPTDRESLFWINFLEVPALPSQRSHLLRLAYRLRMKLLFRPHGLPGSAEAAGRQLAWSVHGNVLKARNSSPFHISVTSLQVGSHAPTAAFNNITVKPFAAQSIPLPDASTAQVIRYEFVGESGELLSAQAAVDHE